MKNESPENFETVIDPRDAKRIAAFEDKLDARIDAGVAYLDERFGKKKWLERVNESVLNIRNGRICITGQLFGDYSRSFLHGEEGMNETKARKLGFLLASSEDELELKYSKKDEVRPYLEGYAILTNLWYCRIRALRKVRGVAYTGK